MEWRKARGRMGEIMVGRKCKEYRGTKEEEGETEGEKQKKDG